MMIHPLKAQRGPATEADHALVDLAETAAFEAMCDALGEHTELALFTVIGFLAKSVLDLVPDEDQQHAIVNSLHDVIDQLRHQAPVNAVGGGVCH